MSDRIARNANRLGLTRKPWVKSSLAPGSKTVKLYLEEANLLAELQQLGFDVRSDCPECQPLGADAQALGQKLARAGFQNGQTLSGRSKPASRTAAAWFRCQIGLPGMPTAWG